MTKTVIVTGANGGIGRALCQLFRKNSYEVIATDREHGAGIACDNFFTADLDRLVRNIDYRRSIFAHLHGIMDGRSLRALVNNAAIQILGRTPNIDFEDWQRTMDVNVSACFLLIQSCLPLLQAGKGSIVNITSIHASLTKPGFVSYATSKAALTGLTRALAVDLGPTVRVNAIAPAATDTAMLRAGFQDNPEMVDRLAALHPLERIATPEEIAAAALFLVSPESSFLSGATLTVDGGIGVRLYDPD